ncbi:unnamed protein product, partial [Polarella glacialis]
VLTGGPFRNRTSGLVRFIDPRKIDVNFVPQQEYGGGDLKRLQRMRLLPLDLDNRWQHAASGAGRQPLTTMPAVTPLFVHWAGMQNRTSMMRSYLTRRFAVPPGWFNRGRSRSQRCSALAALSPRSNPNCAAGAIGSHIEHVYQNWDDAVGPDHVRGKAKEAAAEKTFAEATSSTSTEGSWRIPDRSDDGWTVTAKFRDDVVRLIGGDAIAKSMVAVEIGTYLGYTTSFLAGAFKAVLGVELVPRFAEMTRQLLAGRGQSNAKVLQLNSFRDDFAAAADFTRAHGGADLVLVDGEHAYENVVNDLNLALFAGFGPEERKGRPRFVALDDYFVRAEVAQAALDFIQLGLLRLAGPLGSGEGMLCEVIG